MQGVGNGKFCPNDCVTRGQLVTLLYRYSGETATKEELANLPFRDVKQGRFYTEPIAWAYARGIVKGYDANTFRPDQSVSRQEMSQIFYGYLSYLEVPLPDGTRDGPAVYGCQENRPLGPESCGADDSLRPTAG